MFLVINLAKCQKCVLPALLLLVVGLLACLLVPPVGGNTVQADIQAPSDALKANLPILMYHDILKNPPKQQPYVISPAKLEQDLLFLSRNGYHTVVIEDVVAFVEHGKPLPTKPVMITFDDGYFNNVYYAEPLLQKYGMRAVIFVVGAYCQRAVVEGEENPNYSYIQWDRLTQMVQGGVWDVQSHSWNMHATHGKRMGVQQKFGQTEKQYLSALYKDFSKINDKLTEVTGVPPLAFAYPYGALDDRAEAALRDLGIKVTLCSTSGVSTLVAGQPETLSLLCRYARLNNRSAQMLLSK